MKGVSSESLITVLGVVYAHYKTIGGGDLYLTRYGLKNEDLLAVENWFETTWFHAHKERLDGTSTVYRVPTKSIGGQSMDLVVKNCRVGEDVPGDTETLLAFIASEFNSPWEEFSLTTELRQGQFGPPDISIRTQDPLAIYVPPEELQLWQSGRSRDRLKRVCARHPGIHIDLLKQYKLVYGWIHGRDLVQCLNMLGITEDERFAYNIAFTNTVIAALASKGFSVADMKASHIIIDDADVVRLKQLLAADGDGAEFLTDLIDNGRYSIIDYELLIRTPEHDKEIVEKRRQIYLEDQRDRFSPSPLPPHLKSATVMGVPYVCGPAESTGGHLWVVGNQGDLFDYFLPERWRCTPSTALSDNSEIYLTQTKDHVQMVWKVSRVGDLPQPNPNHPMAKAIQAHGYNSPFEEFAIATDLATHRVGTVYVRAIYRAGSKRETPVTDNSRYRSHDELTCPDGVPLLHSDFNYITIRGYFNGTDEWVARHGDLCVSTDLVHAVQSGYLTAKDAETLMATMLLKLYRAGYDGSFLTMDDFLVAITPHDTLLETTNGDIDVRICNFELIQRRSPIGHHKQQSMS